MKLKKNQGAVNNQTKRDGKMQQYKEATGKTKGAG